MSDLAPLAAPSRTRAFLWTLGTGQALTFVTLGVAFVSTPVILSHLGSDRFGLWRVLEVWFGYLGIGMHCLTLATGFLLVPRLASPAAAELRQFINAVWRVAVGMSAATVAVGLALVPALSWVAAGPNELGGERLVGFLIVLLGSSFLAPVLVLRALLEADQKGYWLNLGLAFQSLTVTSIGVWLAVSGAGLPGQAVAVVGGSAMLAVLLSAITYRTYPWVGPGHPSPEDARVVFQKTLHLLLLGILGGVASRVETLVVNGLAGPEATTQYALSQRLFMLYAGLATGFANSIWVPISDLYHRGEHDWVRDRLGRAILLVTAIGLAGSVPIAVYTPAFLDLWVGPGYSLGLAGRLGFAIQFALLGLHGLFGWMLAATGHLRAMLVSTTLFFLTTLAATGWLGTYYGPDGVAWGAAVGLGVVVAVNLWILGRAFGLSARWVAIRLTVLTGIALGYGAALECWNCTHPAIGWGWLVADLAVAWAGCLGLTGVIATSHEDRRELLRRFWKQR